MNYAAVYVVARIIRRSTVCGGAIVVETIGPLLTSVDISLQPKICLFPIVNVNRSRAEVVTQSNVTIVAAK